jgi:hypothetical protein
MRFGIGLASTLKRAEIWQQGRGLLDLALFPSAPGIILHPYLFRDVNLASVYSLAHSHHDPSGHTHFIMEYRPLDQWTNEIRLLTILPESPQSAQSGLPSPIICRLDHYSLDAVTVRFQIWLWCRDAIRTFFPFPSWISSLFLPVVHDGLAFHIQHFSLAWVTARASGYAFRKLISLNHIPAEFICVIACLLVLAYRNHPDFFVCYHTFREAWTEIRQCFKYIAVFVCVNTVLISALFAVTQKTTFLSAFMLAVLFLAIRKAIWTSEINRPDFCEDTVFRYTWGDYVALSYTWGDSSSKKPIIVNGQVMLVTENLAAALLMYQGKVMATRGMKIWVDAICINQEDVQERNVQVKRMLSIYQMAWTVVVWLGSERDNSDVATQWIHSISFVYNGTYGPVARRKIAMIIYPKVTSEYYRALGCFLARPYWARMWIIQELSVVQNRSPLFCGEESFTWQELTDVLEFVWHDWDRLLTGLQQTGLPLFQDASKAWILIMRLRNIVELIKNRQSEGSLMTLGRLIALCELSETTDDRDRIYAFLGLLEPAISDEVTPNYELSTQHVYTSFTKTVIEATKDLNVIHGGNRSEMQTSSPTWAVDYRRSAGRARPSFDDPFNACLGQPAQVSFSPCTTLDSCDGLLTCKGFLIDTIDGVSGDPLEWFAGSPTGASILQSTATSHAYVNDEGLAAALDRTLIGHRLPDRIVLPQSILELPWFADSTPDVGVLELMRGLSIGKVFTSEWFKDFESFRRVNATFSIFGRPFRDFFAPAVDLRKDYETIALQMMFTAQALYGKKLVTTENGYLGLGVNAIQPGDKVFILLGSKSPVALRPSPDGYKVVGEMYLQGVMNGEAMKWLEQGGCSLEDVVIC